MTDTNNILSPLFEPANTNDLTPTYNGTIGNIGVFYSDDYSGDIILFNQAFIPPEFVLVDFRGYFFAPQTGNYTFTYLVIDDKGWTWLGDFAKAGWNASNPTQYAPFPTCNPDNTCSYTVPLVSGTYYPFRSFFAQASGDFGVYYQIFAPDGTMISSSIAYDSEYNIRNDCQYFVHYSCDGTTAPAYPAWGSES